MSQNLTKLTETRATKEMERQLVRIYIFRLLQFVDIINNNAIINIFCCECFLINVLTNTNWSALI